MLWCWRRSSLFSVHTSRLMAASLICHYTKERQLVVSCNLHYELHGLLDLWNDFHIAKETGNLTQLKSISGEEGGEGVGGPMWRGKGCAPSRLVVTEQELCPDWSPSGIYFKFSDDHAWPFHIRVEVTPLPAQFWPTCLFDSWKFWRHWRH